MTSAADGDRSDRLSLDLSRLRLIRPRDVALRFAFGAGASVVAGAVALRLGSRVGGLFLAFPAILPASLTLIEEKEGRAKAIADAEGGQLGGVGMIAFGLVAAALLPRTVPVLALLAALAAWVVVAVGLYLALRRLAPGVWGEEAE